jgi:hypothetical protein
LAADQIGVITFFCLRSSTSEEFERRSSASNADECP